MFSLLSLLGFKKKKSDEPKLYVIGGKECPICGDYGLFKYNTKERGVFYRCEDCFREISDVQYKELKKKINHGRLL